MEIFGYLDPGTGSLFIQSVIGVGLAVAVVFRKVLGGMFDKFKSLVVRQPAKNEEE